jgi:hypothetical protein
MPRMNPISTCSRSVLIKLLFFVILVSIGLYFHYFVYQSFPPPCQDLAAEHCKGQSSWHAYECLRKLDKTILTDECDAQLKIHRSCRVDIIKHCNGMELSGDVVQCLSRVQNMTNTCHVELNPPWKSNKHLDKYQQRRLQERKE